jgi:hypothetical protein
MYDDQSPLRRLGNVVAAITAGALVLVLSAATVLIISALSAYLFSDLIPRSFPRGGAIGNVLFAGYLGACVGVVIWCTVRAARRTLEWFEG